MNNRTSKPAKSRFGGIFRQIQFTLTCRQTHFNKYISMLNESPKEKRINSNYFI